MTQIVWISGSQSALRAAHLLQVNGLQLAIHSVRTLPSGERRIAGYATDDAMAWLQQQQGLTVQVVVDAGTLAEQTHTLFGQITRAPGEPHDTEAT
jgi:uncharacterized protein YdgA (DUF945 family)